jgi:hypothetical protein
MNHLQSFLQSYPVLWLFQQYGESAFAQPTTPTVRTCGVLIEDLILYFIALQSLVVQIEDDRMNANESRYQSSGPRFVLKRSPHCPRIPGFRGRGFGQGDSGCPVPGVASTSPAASCWHFHASRAPIAWCSASRNQQPLWRRQPSKRGAQKVLLGLSKPWHGLTVLQQHHRYRSSHAARVLGFDDG